MPPFRWEDIDHSLVSLRLTELAIEMHDRIKKDEARIQFENRQNLNSNARPSLVLRMKQKIADEWAQRIYEIYCDVWQKQGCAKCAAFLRAVFARAILPALRARTGAIVGEFSRFATATNFHSTIRDATLNSFRLNMQKLEGHWQRRLEIEARECEHAERRAMLAQDTEQVRDMVTENTPMQALAGASPQPPVGGDDKARGSERSIPNADSSPEPKKPGRSPKLAQPFINCAGMLWRKAFSDNHSKVSLDQLRQIASELDAAGHVPPTAHLEGKCAQELKSFNSRNANSKIGPVKTWSQLISVGDKDHLRGMRRLLSRCAAKLDNSYWLSGN